MSTIKSDDSNITINASGSGRDIKFQANGVEVGSLSSSGVMTATTFTGAATDSTKLPLAGGTVTGTLIANKFQSGDVATNASATLKYNGSNPALELRGGGSATALQIDAGNNSQNYAIKVVDENSGNDVFSVRKDSGAETSNKFDVHMSGVVTMPSQPAFSATKSGGNQTSIGVIVFNTVQTNIGNHYNNSNGRFTAPVAGQYYFSVFLMSSNDPSAFDVTFRKNGSLYTPFSPYFGDGPQYTQISGSAVVTLAANDYVDFELQATGGGQVYGSGPNGKHSNFSGFLIG